MSDIFKTDKGHIKNACMINCIREKLVSKGKWNLLREHILTDIGLTELIDDEGIPLSIDNIMPFFVKRKINLVCLDAFNNLSVKGKLFLSICSFFFRFVSKRRNKVEKKNFNHFFSRRF